MATVQSYVNTASVGGDGTTNATSGANAAYASLASWEANSGGSATDDYVVDCCGGADSTAVTLDFPTNITTGSVTIRANRSDPAGFYTGPLVLSTDHYHLAVAGSCLTQNEGNSTVDGIQFLVSHATGFAGAVRSTIGGSSGQHFTIKNCRMLNTAGTDYGIGFGAGVSLGGGGTTQNFENNLVVGFDAAGIYSNISTHTTKTVNILHNTVYGDGSSSGIRALTSSGEGNPTVNVIGNAVANSGSTATINVTLAVGTVNYADNAIDDYPLGTTDEISLGSAASAWTNPGSSTTNDFTVKDSSSALYQGVSPTVLTTDLLGYTRDGASHDIGAYELQSGGGPTVYTLDAQPVAIGASPQVGSPLAQRRLSADSASVAITGEIATLVKVALVSGVWDTGKWDQSLWDTEVLTYSFAADPVQIALTGGEAATAAIRRLGADPASSTITAQTAATLAKRALDAQAVPITVTGADAGLNKLGSYSIEAQPISLSLAAQTAGLAVIRRLSAEPVTVALTAAQASGYARRHLAADVVAVSIAGLDAGLHRSGYYPIEANPASTSILLADAGLVVKRLGQSVRSTGGGGGGGQLWRQMGEEIEEEMHALLRDPEPAVAHPLDVSPLKAAVAATIPEPTNAEAAFAEALREYQLAQAELLRRRRERRKRILLLA